MVARTGKVRRTLLVGRAALLPLALLLTACSSSSNNQAKATQAATSGAAVPATPIAANATTTEGELILGVTANDFTFTLNRTTVPAGRVHVQLVNQSKDYQHEVWVYPQQQPKLQDLLAQKRAGKDVEESEYLQGLAGHVEDVPPGNTAAFDVSLTAGTYELACFITSTIGGKQMVHYDMGMHTLLTVQ